MGFQERCLNVTFKEEQQSSMQQANRNSLPGPCVCTPTFPCLILIQPQSLFSVGSGRARNSQRLTRCLWLEGGDSMTYSGKWKVLVWLEQNKCKQQYETRPASNRMLFCSSSQTFWSQDPLAFLKIIENPKVLVFMWFTPTDICHTKN